jgi:hypothetical protein
MDTREPTPMRQDPTAGVVITLAFLAFTAFVVWMLRSTTRPAQVITSVAILVAVLPAVLYAVYGT